MCDETLDEPVYYELLALSHQAEALIHKHFSSQGGDWVVFEKVQNKLGELAGRPLYYETIIRMTNAQRREMLLKVRLIVERLEAGHF